MNQSWTGISLFVLQLFLSVCGFAQTRTGVTELDWQEVQQYEITSELRVSRLYFNGAIYTGSTRNPVYSYQREVQGRPARVNAVLKNPVFELLNSDEAAAIDADS